MKLSIVVPLYNEQKRMLPGLEKIGEFLESRDYPCEVVLVDDGSTDDTKAEAERFCEGKPKFRLVSYPYNKSKGEAVKVGMLNAEGEVRLFTDVDLSVPIEKAQEFFEKVQSGADIVIGTRKTGRSQVLVHQPKYREVLGEVYRWIVRAVFAPGITDFTCGFKAFSAKAAITVFTPSRIRRWSFDTEILFLAKKWGFSIVEIPVKWTNSPATKVNLALDVARSGWELLIILINRAMGKYPNP